MASTTASEALLRSSTGPCSMWTSRAAKVLGGRGQVWDAGGVEAEVADGLCDGDALGVGALQIGFGELAGCSA